MAGSQVHQPKTGLSRVPRLSAPLKKAAEATFFNAFGALTIPAADYYIGGYMETINKVTLIGAGAVGAVVASSLTQYLGKSNVQILADGERLNRYKTEGIYINGIFQDFNYVSPANAQKTDLVIIATKNLQLNKALDEIKNTLKEDTIILSLLNGIQSEKDIAQLYGWERTVYGFVLSLNSIHEKNKIECTNRGTLYFGEKDNSITPRINALKNLFTSAQIKNCCPENIHLEQWKKLLINVTFNTLSALCRSTYGAFNLSVMQELALKTGSEVIQVANAENVPLTHQMLEKDIELMCSHDPVGKTSMLQDIEAGRETENAWFCGTIMSLAEKHGIDTPVCRMLYSLIKGTEESEKYVRTLKAK